MSAPRLREEREVLTRQRHQVLVGDLSVLERVGRQRLGDVLGGGVGVEDEVDDRVGGGAGVVAEGVVQQVVEDLAVEVGLGAVVVEEPLRGAGAVFPDAGQRVAHPDRQGAQLFQVAGHLVRLAVEHRLEAMLDLPEEAVGVLHDRALLGGQAPDLFEPGDPQEGVGVADLGILAAVQELEELDDELDVADAAAPGLDLEVGGPGRDGALLDPTLHRLDLADLGAAEVAAVDERRDRVEEGPAEVEVAGEGAALDQGLALPGPAGGLVVAQGRRQRAGQGPLVSLGPEPHVDAVGPAERGVVGEEPNDVAAHPGEELGVRDDARAGGLALDVIEEDQVDVGAVVQLLAAELPHRQHDEPRGLALVPGGDAVPGLGPAASQPAGDLDAGVGQLREVEGDHLERDAAHDVVVADPEDLALAEPPQHHPLGLLVAGGDRLGPELGDQRLAVAALGADAEPVEQGRVADDQLAEVLARAEELDQDLGRPGVADQVAQGRLGHRAGRHEPFQVRQGHVGVGTPWQEAVELGREPGDQGAGPPPLGQVAEVAEPALGVADPQAREPAPSRLGIVQDAGEPVGGREERVRHHPGDTTKSRKKIGNAQTRDPR